MSQKIRGIAILMVGLSLGFLLGFYSHSLKAPTTFEECAVREGVGKASTEMAATIIADMCWERFKKGK